MRILWPTRGKTQVLAPQRGPRGGGQAESGAKHGKWRLYDDQGNLLHEYIYNYGKLRKVDGSKVDKRRDGIR